MTIQFTKGPVKKSGLKLLKMWNAQLPPLRCKEADGVHMVSPLSSFHIVLLAIAASKDWRPEMTLQDTCCLPFSLLLGFVCCRCCECCLLLLLLLVLLLLLLLLVVLSAFSISAANPTSVPLSCHMRVKHIEKLCAKGTIPLSLPFMPWKYSCAPIRDLGKVVFQGYKRIYPC